MTPWALTERAKEMRRAPTVAENRLWQRLRRRQLGRFRFRRQEPIGRYIVDFYCHQARLVVEVDGGIHERQREYDEVRTEWLEAHGYRVVRFTNEAVLERIEEVLTEILLFCEGSAYGRVGDQV